MTLTKCAGSFDSGKTRTNEAEAASLTEELVNCFKDAEKSKRTYGIVTFNIQQQSLIEDKIDEECRKDPEFEKWAFGGEEPIFIKNLENVQGDERDVILFSVGYGPDSEGKQSMNFGPLNKDGGWRRLNVAVTRSRCEMKVFSSIEPETLRVTEATPEGVKAFKRFLMYAEGNSNWDADILASAAGEGNSPVIDRSADFTGIADDICARLGSLGYEVERRVGDSGFKVDIGVTREGEKQYCLGILIDGAGVNKNDSAYSREISQPGVLRGLGWEILRVWSIDWWEDPDAVMDAIVSKIENKEPEVKPDKPEKAEAEQTDAASSEVAGETEVEASETAPAEEDAAEQAEPAPGSEIPITHFTDQVNSEEAEAAEDTEPEEESGDVKKKTESVAEAPVPYMFWDGNLGEMTSAEFRDARNTPMLTEAVRQIVEIEAPISFDVLVDRLSKACGITRKNPVIVERCDYLVKNARIYKTAQNLSEHPTPDTKKIFLWHYEGEEDGIPEHYRVPAEGDKPRDAQDITFQEAARCAIYVCKTQFGMPREDLIRQTSHALGFKNSGGWVGNLSEAAVNFAVSRGELSETPLKIV